MLYKPLYWKVTFLVTSKPTPPPVFNLQASDLVRCEEEPGAHTGISQLTSKLVNFFKQISECLFCPKNM